MFQNIAKHRANDASNDVHRPPLHVSQAHKEIKDNRHKVDIGGALIRKC